MIKTFILKLTPSWLLSGYHLALAAGAAWWYGRPDQKLYIIGITGTKGKSTVAELVETILTTAGYKTALLSTIRFKINQTSRPNKLKMTMPGRWFIHQFLAQAVNQGCTHAIIEMTSEGAKLWRHRFIDLDALIFTNLSPEHIEAHGGFEQYLQAKLAIGRRLINKSKNQTLLIVNADDPASDRFAAINPPRLAKFSLSQLADYHCNNRQCQFNWQGQDITLPLGGEFNLKNALAAISLAQMMNIEPETVKRALEAVDHIPGRLEYITVSSNQPMMVVVDYAHTPESLTELYQTFSGQYKICVLGNTGGGRDRWKRPVMGQIADQHCQEIILTNEDPYDEDPGQILADMKAGIAKTDYQVILDRRQAIRQALKQASNQSAKPVAVLITGKGTDPYIMIDRGQKIPWSDKAVTKEELTEILKPTQ